jgi:hypothetical protein
MSAGAASQSGLACSVSVAVRRRLRVALERSVSRRPAGRREGSLDWTHHAPMSASRSVSSRMVPVTQTVIPTGPGPLGQAYDDAARRQTRRDPAHTPAPNAKRESGRSGRHAMTASAGKGPAPAPGACPKPGASARDSVQYTVRSRGVCPRGVGYGFCNGRRRRTRAPALRLATGRDGVGRTLRLWLADRPARLPGGSSH